MNPTIHAWVDQKVKAWNLASLSILEVGSLNENGGVRDCFAGPYIGVDMHDVPGVDQVMNGHDLTFDTGTFDAVVCTEMLEHDPAFWLSLTEIGRVLRHGGHLLLTTRGNGFPEHRYPSDYWRFMLDAGGVLADIASCDLLECTPDSQPEAAGIFVHGVRR